VCARLLGEQAQHVHRLGEHLPRDPRDAAVVCDAEHVLGLPVAGEHAVAQLRREALQSAVGEVDVAAEPFLELDTPALLFAAFERGHQSGTVTAHGGALVSGRQKPSPRSGP